jgi:hypothetical protein
MLKAEDYNRLHLEFMSQKYKNDQRLMQTPATEEQENFLLALVDDLKRHLPDLAYIKNPTNTYEYKVIIDCIAHVVRVLDHQSKPEKRFLLALKILHEYFSGIPNPINLLNRI